MFFQVKLRKENQSFLKFLLRPDGDMEKEIAEYCMTVHLFGAGSSPACANYALKRIADDNEDEYGIAGGSLHTSKNLDVLKSSSTEDEAIKIANNVTEQLVKMEDSI